MGFQFSIGALAPAAPPPPALISRMGGLIGAGGGGTFLYELSPNFKDRFREGGWTGNPTMSASGWPTSSHGVMLGEFSGTPSWAVGNFSCGFIGTGTPTGVNGTVSNLVFGNGTSTYTTFTLSGVSGNFGFNINSGAFDHFAYLPAYNTLTGVSDPTNPSSVTNEAVAYYAAIGRLRNCWPQVSMWNSQQCTSANRNTPTNTQCYGAISNASGVVPNWFGQQTATVGSLAAQGATSNTLVGWTRGPGTWSFVMYEGATFGYERRICTVGSGVNPTITWSGGLAHPQTTTNIYYGMQGYPVEWSLAIAVAANVDIECDQPCLQDGTNFLAGSHTAAEMAVVQTYMTNYPAWTGKAYFVPGNENWNGTYNTYGCFVAAAALGGFPDIYSYGGAWMHAQANLGRTQFGALWGPRANGILEWQLAQPQQFLISLNYISTTLGGTPSADFAYGAVAPYMNPAVTQTSGAGGTQPTIADIQAAVAANAATIAAISLSCNTAILLMNWGIQLKTYEENCQWSTPGTQVGGYTGITNLQAAIMDPGYTAPMESFYNNLSNSGFQAFCRSTLSTSQAIVGGTGSGLSVGTVYPVSAANTPNWAALLQVAQNNPTFFRNVINGRGSILLGGNYGDNTGAANPVFPSGLFVHTNGSPYFNTKQGYVGWFFNCLVPLTYTFAVSGVGSGTPATNVEIGSLSGFSAVAGGPWNLSSVSAVNTGSLFVPAGPGYILLGNGTPQSTLAISQIQFN